MTAFLIREMTEADWPDVGRIYQEGVVTNLATYQSEYSSWEEFDTSHLQVCRLVIADCDRVVGWAMLKPYSSRRVYEGVAEVSIYISENSRGRGVGKTLLMELIRRSEESGFWTLQSGIFTNNTASIRLHESCGFRAVGYRERIGRDRFGNWRDVVLMERRSKHV